MRCKPRVLHAVFLLFFFFPLPSSAGYPVTFDDAASRSITINRAPQRVVSVVPAVTEMLFRIGAGDAVVGVTYHDTYPPEAATKSEIGGFFSPSLERIELLKPDTIFISNLHQTITSKYEGQNQPRLIQLPLSKFEDVYKTILRLGEIFNRQVAAEKLVQEIRAELAHTATKVSAIPDSERKRVIRLMGRNRVMAPGDDSFQNEMIRLAGGIPPKLEKNGALVPVSLEEWQRFNPQVIYGCGGDRKTAEKLLGRPGWKAVDAVQNGQIRYFPCDLTCRLSSRTGYFVSCLAATLYGEKFASLPSIKPDEKLGSKPVSLPLGYVDKAEIVESRVNDYTHKTLLLQLHTPMSVTSTLEGQRDGIRFVGNSYSPPQVWALYHRIGLEASRRQLLKAIGRDRADTSLLFTGADMDNLSVQKQQFKEMVVYALVTAGVRSNAVRMAEDVGRYYEPGTINMVILSNMRLTRRAMSRAIVSATEAKTAALQDLDVRSAYTPMIHPATGTGTDNIIVVEGAGTRIDNAGGHAKMGELMAKAVYAGVKDAIYRQNGLVQQRSLFRRLKERDISLFGLVGECSCGTRKAALNRAVERLLLEPQTAGFMEAALVVSDAYERGLITDIGSFQAWSDQVAERIAGRPLSIKQAFPFSAPMPRVLQIAFEALLNGITAKTPVNQNTSN